MFGKAFKDNEWLHKAYLFGVLKINEVSLFSCFNNATEENIYQKIGNKCFLFSEKEVKQCI
jgi:hypothetical protein